MSELLPVIEARPTLADRILGPKGSRAYRLGAIIMGTLGVGLTLLMWWQGRAYYGIAPDERFDHELHTRLRSAGIIGHMYGIVGTLLIITNLLYFVRKHAKFMRGRGSLRLWMEVHVFAGLAGSMMIVFHSAFQVRNQVAEMASISLAVLVVTGLLGRYMYSLLPHTMTGEEADASEVGTEVAVLRRQLAQAIGDTDLAKQAFALLAPQPVHHIGPVLALAKLPLLPVAAIGRQRTAWRVGAMAKAAGQGDPVERGHIIRIARAILQLEGQRHAVAIYRNVFLWWRALHRGFALVMVVAMLIHVSVALYFGYRWIWS